MDNRLASEHPSNRRYKKPDSFLVGIRCNLFACYCTTGIQPLFERNEHKAVLAAGHHLANSVVDFLYHEYRLYAYAKTLSTSILHHRCY